MLFVTHLPGKTEDQIDYASVVKVTSNYVMKRTPERPISVPELRGYTVVVSYKGKEYSTVLPEHIPVGVRVAIAVDGDGIAIRNPVSYKK